MNFLLIIVFLLSFFLSGCNKNNVSNKSVSLEESANNYKKQRNLFGTVKSLKVTRYKVINEFGNITKGEITEKYLKLINKNGEIIEKDIFNSDGTLEKKYISKYASNGNKIELTSYDINKNLLNKEKFQYNEKNNLIDIFKYKWDGSLEYKIIYVYDKSDKKIEENLFKSGNWYKSSYKYNKKGKIIYKNQYYVLFYKNGYFERVKSIYKYDSKGRKYEKSLTYSKDGILYLREENLYDSNGKLIESKSFNLNKNIYKYDSNNNLIQEKSFRENGSLYSLTNYKYDSWGNLLRKEIHVDISQNEWSNLIEYDYEYDNYNNWVRSVYSDNKIPKEITIREIKYYK